MRSKSNKNRAFLVLLTSAVGWTAGQKRALPQPRLALPTQGLDTFDRVHLQVSPRPTESPEANGAELFRRAESVGTNTCGFLTTGHSPFPCPEDNTCTNIGDFRGCCKGAGCTTSSFASVCLDSTAPACASDPGTGTMCCTESEHPFCVTYLWATTATPNRVFSLYVCDTDVYAGQQFLDAEPLPATTTSDPDTSTESTSTDGSTSKTPKPVGTAPANGDGGDDDEQRKSDAVNIGAIVGGVLGGVALIGVIVLVAVWMVFRKRKARMQDAANYNGDGYDPHASPSAPGTSIYAPSGYQPVAMAQGPSPSLGSASIAPGHSPYAYQSYNDASKFGPQGEHDAAKGPTGVAAEVPAENPVGLGSNRAELPS